MARPRPAPPDFSGDRLAVRVTPRAAAERVEFLDGPDGMRARVWVTAPPEDGQANAAVAAALARALGVPKSALTLARGATGRDKLFRITRGG